MTKRNRLLLVSIGLAAAGLLRAQTAQISGRVVDTSGAVIPGAAVTVTRVETKVARTTRTNQDGYYAVPLLEPGNYAVAVRHTGMQAVTREGITLQVDQSARLDFRLQVGAVSQTLQVTGEAPLVNSESATVGAVVENRRIVDLPLNGRNTLALTLLTPGVRSQAGPTNSGFGDRGIALSAISINGGPSGQNEFLLDGNINNSGQDYEVGINPAVDAVQEFKVQSNSMSAEYGFTTGGVVNMVTKSGGNAFHGTLYEFVRNDAFDARNAFAVTRAPFRYNQYGGAIGGPVLLPRLYNGRNRTFFFVNAEEWQYRRTTNPISTVPTLNQRAGNFSDLRDATGKLIPIYDPATTAPNPKGSGFIRQPFGDNTIPANLLDPVSHNVLPLIPEPNRTPINAFTGQNNFLSSIVEQRYMKQVTTKVDHHFSDYNSLYGRYSFFRHFTNGAIGSNPWPNPVVNERLDTLTPQNFVLGDTQIVSPSTLNEFRAGYMRLGFPFVARSYGEDWPRKLGLPDNVPDLVLPRISISGLPGFTQSDVGFRGAMTWDLTDTLTLTRANHTIKIGPEIRLYQLNNYQASVPSGQFNFTSTLTGNPQAPSGTGSGFASFLLGSVANASMGTYLGQAMKGWSASFFVQDDWKVTARLTVNLGLRYDYQSPPIERNNGVSNFDPYGTNPLTHLPGLMDYGQSYLRPDFTAFSPRLGLAYDLFGDRKTVLRAGYGVFRPNIFYREFFGNTAGFATTTTTYDPPGGNTNLPAFQFRNGVPSPPTAPLGAVLGPSAFLSSAVTYDQQSDKYPLSQQWDASLEHQIHGVLIDATYSANKGVHLVAGNYEYNDLDPQYWSMGLALQDQVANPYYGAVPGSLGGRTISRAQTLKPFPYYTSVSVRNPALGNSIYNAFLLSVEKRFSASGLALLASYSNQKLIDDSVRATVDFGSVEQVSVVGYQTGKFNRRLERSLDPTDVSQRLVLSGVYELPFGKGKHWSSGNGAWNQAIGGWQINSITTVQGGLPLVVRGASNFLADRPNSTGKSARLAHPTQAEWFDTSAFVNPPNFTLGDVGRVLPDVRSPGDFNIDFSLIKDTNIGERFRLQFRAEAFNVLNTVNLGFPNASFVAGPDGLNRSATFGTISSARDARVIQLGMKLLF